VRHWFLDAVIIRDAAVVVLCVLVLRLDSLHG
jgi:hypothetical protein